MGLWLVSLLWSWSLWESSWNVCFDIPNCLMKHLGWLTRSSSNHICPDKINVLIGISVNDTGLHQMSASKVVRAVRTHTTTNSHSGFVLTVFHAVWWCMWCIASIDLWLTKLAGLSEARLPHQQVFWLGRTQKLEQRPGLSQIPIQSLVQGGR